MHRPRPAPGAGRPSAPALAGLAPSVFISYARSDQSMKDELLVHLGAFEWSGSITVAHDRDISPGSDWDAEIRRALASCSVALLLVSKDFLVSNYIRQVELPILQRRWTEGNVRLLPIILGPCVWEPVLGEVAALPASGAPINLKGRKARDGAWREIALAVHEIVQAPELRAAPAPAGENGPPVADVRLLADPQQAADLLLALPAPDAAGQLDELLTSCGGRSARRRCLADLVGQALRSKVYIPALLTRCFADLSPEHAGWLRRKVRGCLRDGSATVLGPALLNQEVEEFLSAALIECARARTSCIIVSCIGMSDNLNLEPHIQTLAVSSLEVYLNSPRLLHGLGDRDEQLESPDAVKDDYMLSRGDGDVRVDVLRKLTRLLTSLDRLASFRGLLEENGVAGGVAVRFHHERRPPFTCRVLREAGHFVLFPDSIPLPRPLVRFAIVGRDVDLAQSLVLASSRLVPADQQPWVPTRAGVEDLLEESITILAPQLKQYGYTPRDLEALQPALGVRSRGEGWIAHRMLTGIVGRM